MTKADDEVIWATSMTGEDFQCVHVDAWREQCDFIDELQQKLDEISSGHVVTMPASIEHAEAMLLVAKQYIDDRKKVEAEARGAR